MLSMTIQLQKVAESFLVFSMKVGGILLVFSKKDGKGFLIFSQKLARSKVGPIGKLEVGGKAPLLSNLRQLSVGQQRISCR